MRKKASPQRGWDAFYSDWNNLADSWCIANGCKWTGWDNEKQRHFVWLITDAHGWAEYLASTEEEPECESEMTFKVEEQQKEEDVAEKASNLRIEQGWDGWWGGPAEGVERDDG